jgi:AcrR family transcriptional regulator
VSGRGNTGRRRTLTRERILDAGIAIADAEGIDAVTIRRVSAALNVHPMSLYNHVSKKDDLLDGMAARLLGGLAIPDIASMHWKQVTRAVGGSYRRLGLDHPALFPYIVSRPYGSSDSVSTLDQFLGAYRRSGFSPTSAYLAFVLLTGFVEGFTLGEISRRRPGLDQDPVINASLAASPPDVYPAMSGVFVDGMMSDDEAFERCLDLVIVAIERLVS